MAINLQIDNLIKFIIGAVLILVIVGGVYLFFKNSVIDFFQNLLGGNSTALHLILLK